MTDLRTKSLLLVLGVAIGSGTTAMLRPHAGFAAQSSMGCMSMESKSVGDTEMNAAMGKMTHAMDTAKLTGDQDRDFMLMMIPHHRSAVDMARIELRRGHHPELKALANDIVGSQDREIGQMHAWLNTWYHVRP